MSSKVNGRNWPEVVNVTLQQRIPGGRELLDAKMHLCYTQNLIARQFIHASVKIQGAKPLEIYQREVFQLLAELITDYATASIPQCSLCPFLG